MIKLVPKLILFIILLAQTGTIVGNVIDKTDREPLIGVNIIIRGTSFGTVTDLDGNYEIRSIRPGEYSVEFRYIGYESVLYTGIRVEAGQPTTINVELNSQVITSSEDIIVIGERPIFDVEQSSTGTTFSSDQISVAPVTRVDQVVGMT